MKPAAPAAPRPAEPGGRRGLQASMTAQLAARQFGLLFLAATALLLMTFFLNYYGVVNFNYLWNELAPIGYKSVQLPALLVVVYGYVLLSGILFALGPSEKGFTFFFGAMILALLVINYDHSVLDWFLFLTVARIIPPNPVSVFKIVLAGLFMLVVIAMHYNVLADDFARRMIQRGLPTEEAARIRPGMFKVLVPTVLTAAGVATGLALVGEFGALVFQQSTLFLPKLELLLLAALVVPMAFLIRAILRAMGREDAQAPPPGPNG